MTMKNILAVFSAALLSSFVPASGNGGVPDGSDGASGNGYREILRMQESGMHSRSRLLLKDIARESGKSSPEGYAVLSEVSMGLPGYEARMDAFISEHPYSVLVPQMRYLHALNLFDSQDYKGAGELLETVPASCIGRSRLDEYLFKKAYCDLEAGELDRALLRFAEIDRRPLSDFTAPARYGAAYINYGKKNFREALEWFGKSVSDARFRDISNYYIMECRFMLKDYRFVADNGEQMYGAVPEDRKPHLARIISESWLVLGDAGKARKYYDLGISAGEAPKTRADWFYSGSVLYAVKDYRGAVECFSNMESRTDSIGQIANYQLGYSYIQTKNKVAALDAFKAASEASFDPEIAEDAHFNWAKLAFDINNDSSVFSGYISKYPDREKDDRIYNYIAVAALHNRDYAAAVDAYGMIDELDEGMRNNYMKANYLRASQLVANGSWRMAVPCLKVAAYYSDRNSRFNQLTRFWLAESYYRSDRYDEALEVLTDLYNMSALYRQPEFSLIPYGIAYCHFRKSDYPAAMKWFNIYVSGKSKEYRKDALERIGDCHFIVKDYKNACLAYDRVAEEYNDVNDIYPYYQAAIAYGLSGKQDKKISVLSKVFGASADAEFYPEALFELGRAYVVKEDDENAFKCFRTLADGVKDSSYVARAYLEMGSLARNQSQFNDALGYYKAVVEQMSGSGYAEDALAAIESVYQTRNEPEEYLAYIEALGMGSSKTPDEREEMIFGSAEQIYLSGNYQKALAALQSYRENYPAGKNVCKSDFYMAESYRNLGKYEQACDCYEKVIADGSGAFVELSMLNFSDLSYRMERWDDALGGYSSLYSSALLENNKSLALYGMMRSAYRAHKYDEAIKNADVVLLDGAAAGEIRREADFIKARSYLATSRRNEAFGILSKLATDVSDGYGAEAAYLIILDSYDKGDFESVQAKAYEFADAGSGQNYWLAKIYIVLGDSFAEVGDFAQARATFGSILDGYSPEGPDDDVLDNVKMRIGKLDSLMAETE